MFKEGGFNPYGNGQASQKFTITQPMTQLIGGVWMCTSTCLVPNPLVIIGTGVDQEAAFEDWVSKVIGTFEKWKPQVTLSFLTKLRTLPVPPTDHPLYKLWTDDKGVEGFIQEFFEGYNPYGNGQPVLKKKNWIQINQKRLVGRKPQEVDVMYNKYIKSRQASNKIAMNKQTVRKVTNSQIGTIKPTTYKGVAVKTVTGPNSGRDLIKLSTCAKFYAAALACPFWWLDKSCHVKVASLGIMPTELPCIPTPPPLISRKFNAFARFIVGVQANGNAHIGFAPKRLGNDYGPGDSFCPIIATTTTTTFPTGFPLMDDGGIYSGATFNVNTDYDSASLIVNPLGEGVEYRLV